MIKLTVEMCQVVSRMGVDIECEDGDVTDLAYDQVIMVMESDSYAVKVYKDALRDLKNTIMKMIKPLSYVIVLLSKSFRKKDVWEQELDEYKKYKEQIYKGENYD